LLTLVLVLLGVAYHRAWGKHYPLQPAAPAAAAKAQHLPLDDLSPGRSAGAAGAL
jgi:CBS domain-containing membrane protein